ncbi:hypothetical protein JCM6882_001480 [Rhodosporidiobolus microsporus]
MSSQTSSSSRSASSEPQLHCCGMDDLPTEVKARIVELCAEQDERFKRELANASLLRPKYGAPGHDVYGRSIRALFQVSKEFSGLAAPHVFQVLRASKTDVHFKCGIASSSSRLSFFREAHFDVGNPDSLSNLVGVLPRLTGLSKLVWNSTAINALWDYGPFSLSENEYASPAAQYACSALRRLEGIEELHFKTTVLTVVLPFAQAYQTLRVLRLEISQYGQHSANGLEAALQAAKNLAEFHLTAIGDYPPSRSLPNLANLTLATPPPIRQLSLSANFLSSDWAAFSELFSSTLQSLSFEATYAADYSDYPQPKFTSQVFPKITRLSLKGPESLTYETLDSIEPRMFPALEAVELNFSFVADWGGDDSPLVPFINFPVLRTLSIPTLHTLPAYSVDDIETFCVENGLTLQGSSSVAARILPRSAKDSAADLAAGVRATLPYLEKQVTEAEEQEDLEALKRIKASLSAVEAERVTQRIWEAV